MVTSPSHLPPTATLADLDDLVVLLDDDARPAGTAARRHVHTEDTPLHLAFSLYLLDEDDRLLLTRRALGKTAWPGVWTNTCCGHPRPDESMADAVTRRVEEELGLHVPAPRIVLPDFRYRAVDAGGIVENEICPVFTARPVGQVLPSADEVAEHEWADVADVWAAVERAPWAFSPWFASQVSQLSPDDLLRPVGAAGV